MDVGRYALSVPTYVHSPVEIDPRACRAAIHFIVFTRPQPPEVRDLKSWLKMYGEPSPDKIPTGFLTTFRASKKVMVVVVLVLVLVLVLVNDTILRAPSLPPLVSRSAAASCHRPVSLSIMTSRPAEA